MKKSILINKPEIHEVFPAKGIPTFFRLLPIKHRGKCARALSTTDSLSRKSRNFIYSILQEYNEKTKDNKGRKIISS